MLPNSATINTYGGVKQDRTPVTNSQTTLAASEHNAAVADVAMMTRMAPRAFRRFIGGNPPTEPPSAVAHEALWRGMRTGSGPWEYDPPSVIRDSEGHYRVFWKANALDELGNEVPLNFRWVTVWVESTQLYEVRAALTTPTTVEIACYDGGVDDDLDGVPICIMVW